jgi:hypothetical protein
VENRTSTTRITLIHHVLTSCKAENKINPTDSKGGIVEFSTTLEAPDDKSIIKKGESYLISLLLDCTGKTKDSKDIAFQVSCKMEGVCAVIDGSTVGIKSSPDLWAIPANQLYPLVAQFISDVVSRMGYKNIAIPVSIPDIAVPKSKDIPDKKSKRKK